MTTVQNPDSPTLEKPPDDSDSDSTTTSSNADQDHQQINRLVSRMFGRERKANSQEEQTRHIGVVWKNLTVKGVGLGSVIQPTNLDILLGIPRFIKRLLTRGRQKPPTRTILDDFTVCSVASRPLCCFSSKVWC